MVLKKSQIIIAVFSFFYLISFALLFTLRGNVEFMMYAGFIIGAALLILYTNKYVHYRTSTLVLLSIAGLSHMAGGYVRIGGDVLYAFMILELGVDFFRYDQLVHILSVLAVTLAFADFFKPLISRKYFWRVALVIVFAGLGLGALNEIIEFLVTVTVPQHGVGGYMNTSLDLIANMIGALLALPIIWWREFKN